MQRYRDLSGNSGEAGYAIGRGSITVQFKDGPTYRYTDASAGRAAIATMKRLAARGEGLSTFIAQHVKQAYAERLP